MQYARVLVDRWKSEGGQAIVELTLLMPFFLLLLMGTMDFSRIFYTALALTHAARAGAQYGAQNNVKSQDTAGMQQAAQTAAQDLSSLSVTAGSSCMCTDSTPVNCVTGNCSANGGGPQIYVTVTTSRTFQTLWNYPGVPHTVNLSRTATMRAQ